jgi:hypothetical protein
LKTEVVNLKEEMEELRTHDNKRKEVLEETKEMVIFLKTQLEETKKNEES